MNKAISRQSSVVRKTKNGFTLIEVLVAATIIAVLTAIGVVSYTSINKRSRDTKRKSDMEQIRSALEMYRADIGYYPNTGGGGWANASSLSTELVDNGYMATIPSDPKSATQVYRYKATNLTSGNYYGYCLSSLLEVDYTGVCPPTTTTGTCTPDTVNCHNYGLKSP